MAHAIHIYEQGGPDVLRYEPIDIEKPKAGQVRLRQMAIGVNFLDTYFRKGDFSLPSTPFINGFEAAGIVEEVGEGVTDVEVGQRVAYQLVRGAYTDMRTLSADRLVPLPDTISDEQAAAMMLKGTTVEYLVRRVYPVKAGDTILVHAAAGGVGSLLCQWAKHLGATVIGTVSNQEKADLARANGCDFPILYAQEDFGARVNQITDRKGVPVVYDGVGRSTFHRNFDCLATFGVNVLFGWASGQVEPLDVHRLNSKSHVVVNPSLGHYTGTRELLLESAQALFDVVSKGAVSVSVNHRYPLANAAQAHADLEARRTKGSVVLVT
ncbi:MAG: quinone oxidoreductase family protein [Elainellaceae cyanobacterium]